MVHTFNIYFVEILKYSTKYTFQFLIHILSIIYRYSSEYNKNLNDLVYFKTFKWKLWKNNLENFPIVCFDISPVHIFREINITIMHII